MRTLMLAASLFLLSLPAQAHLVNQDDEYGIICASHKQGIEVCKAELKQHEQTAAWQRQDRIARLKNQQAEHDYLMDGIHQGKPIQQLMKEIENKFHGHD